MGTSSPSGSPWRIKHGLLMLAAAMAILTWRAASAQPQAAAIGSAPQRCVPAAAAFHGVNPLLLEAVLRIESGLRPRTVTSNSNGTVDVGLGGTNSIHFRELARHGIMPQHLLDACVATYVAAWHLRRAQDRHGNTWEGVAAYHSATPAYNWRYRVLLHNELVRMGVIQGRLQRVPSLSQAAAPVVVPPARPQDSAQAGPTRVRIHGVQQAAVAEQQGKTQ